MGVLGRGTAAAVVVGALAGAGWTALSYATDWRLGVLAVPLGALVGAAMASATERRGRLGAGVLAALIACTAMLGSRFALTQLEVNALADEVGVVTAEDAVDALASQIYEARLLKGDIDFVVGEGDFPPDVLAQAEQSWAKMTTPEQEELMAALGAESRAAVEQASPVLLALGMLFNIGLFGFVFMAFGVVLAFKLGAAAEKSAEAAPVAAIPPRAAVNTPPVLRLDGRPVSVPVAPAAHEEAISGPLRGGFKMPVDPLEGTAAGSLSLTQPQSQERRAA